MLSNKMYSKEEARKIDEETKKTKLQMELERHLRRRKIEDIQLAKEVGISINELVDIMH